MWSYVAYLAAKAVMGTNDNIKVAKEQNKTAMAQMGKEINQINLQKAQNQMDTTRAIFNIDVAQGNAESAISLQSASSGTMGASVQDAVSTVQGVTNRQRAGVYGKEGAQAETYRLATERVVDQTHNGMDWEGGSSKLWNNVMGAVGGVIGAAAANAASSAGGTADNNAGANTTQVGQADTQNYGYDLWGKKSGGSQQGTSTQSWKSYLNN